MPKTIKCSRCHEMFVRERRSKFGQVCPWCEESLIATERELSRKCGLHPLTERDLLELNKYWQRLNA